MRSQYKRGSVTKNRILWLTSMVISKNRTNIHYMYTIFIRQINFFTKTEYII